MEYLFAFASILAVVGIFFVGSKMFNDLVEGTFSQEEIQKSQTRFFITAAIVEVIPIFIIASTYVNLLAGELVDLHLYVSIVIIVVFWMIGLAKLYVKGRESISFSPEENQSQTKAVIFISLAFLSGIPIASIMMLLNV
ncbi:hypothetical protein [Halobacillus trueperi]|uniref:Uncharacterized protein n=1 Tax=Halobacillus trueperi TaxID=156205 RepID=A0A3E0J0P0_9BACI|nr:hypothetical protein [Halobacillus trueperi]REJ06493.1 hypothetical protein DYE48_18560 [Halobacillus trueperi]